MDKLFSDLKTDIEKANFFLSGRGCETGVIARAIQNDVAMAYSRCDAAAAAAKRQPLTDAEILHLWAGDTPRPVLGKNKVLAFARAIEAAHGITGEKT